MGILNITPDSFSDGGRYTTLDHAITQAERMIAEGANIIDVGGESSRPGHEPVSASEEMSRVLPVLKEIVRLGVPISIDTMKADVAAAALDEGVAMLNDVWGLQRDSAMADVAAASAKPIVLMHNRHEVVEELDIVEDILRFFDRTLEIAARAGIKNENIILDPGIGFGKTPQQSLTATRHLDRLKAFGFPVLFGASRKRVVGHVTGRAVDDRLAGTLAINAWAVQEQADIIRVHDVAAHVDLVKMLNAIGRA